MLGEKRYEYNPLPLVQERQYLQRTLLISCPESLKDLPVTSFISDIIAKDLKKQEFQILGGKIE